MSALNIALGTELEPAPVVVPAQEARPATPTHPLAVEAKPAYNSNQTKIDNWTKRHRLSLSQVLLSCTSVIRRRLDIKKTLQENWLYLKTTYGTSTCLNVWVDYQSFMNTCFTSATSLATQLDEFANLASRLKDAEFPIPDHMLALTTVIALPDSYEIIKQAILGSIAKLTSLTPTTFRRAFSQRSYAKVQPMLVPFGRTNRRRRRRGSVLLSTGVLSYSLTGEVIPARLQGKDAA